LKNEFSTNALVIHVVPSGENDKLLTLLSAEHGRITAVAKGGRSLKCRYMPATVPFVYGNYELKAGKGSDIFYIRDAVPEEPFRAIGEDIVKTYLAQYIADVLCEFAEPGTESGELLSLALNTLYAISKGSYDDALVKAVFEFRVAAMSGYEPELTGCRICGKPHGDLDYLDVMNGGLLCPECAAAAPKLPQDAPAGMVPTDRFGTRSVLMPLSASSLAAVEYVLEAPVKRMLAFSISSTADKNYFCRAAETYLLSHLERGFSSLKQYKELAGALS